MAKRGCEKVYFTKYCIPKGLNVKSYYTLSFLTELISIIALYAVILILRVNYADEFVPSTAFTPILIAIPAAVIIAEFISLFVNFSMITTTIKSEKALAEDRDGNNVSEEEQR